jgi:hypothetical protein
MFAALANNDKFTKLCLLKDNRPVWSKNMLWIMKVSELNSYLFGRIPEPNIVADAVLHHYWVGNNNKLVGFHKMYIDNGELPSLLSDSAHTIWKNLLTPHEKQGPITQVCLIQEVLSISYSRDITTWQATTDRMSDLCDHIYAQAVPTKDVMFMLTMLTGLECEADNIRSEMTSYYVSNKAADSSALSKHIKQEIMYKNKHKNPSDTALTAQARNCCNQGSCSQGSRSTKICSNPICPHPNGHLGSDCWEKGGIMEGKRDKVLARCTRAHEERERKKNDSPGASGIRCDKTGQPYIINSISGDAIFLASAKDPKPPKPVTTLAAYKPSTDPIDTSMSEADRFENNALFLEDHSTSINLHEKRRVVSARDALVASMNTNTRTTLSVHAGPFILDSGAIIHISPDTSDSFELRPIPPQNDQRYWRVIH